jgi:hypothetical protein
MNAQSNPGPVDFDLSRGRVDRRAPSDGGGAQDEQVALVPISALIGLEKLAGVDATRKFARTIGVSLGRRVASRLGSGAGVAGAPLEAFVSALATEVAVSGWGALHVERWGKAMVLVVEHAPALPSGVFAALLEGAVEAAAAREVHAVALTGERSDSGVARVLIASQKSAEEARRWIIEGANEAVVIQRLHDGGKRAGGAG